MKSDDRIQFWRQPLFSTLLFSFYKNIVCFFLARRAFLKRPENFSGPKTFQGSFRVNFSGPGKRISTRPKTPRILTRVSGGFLRFAVRAWQWFVKNLNWHGCTELGSSRTLQIKPSFVDSFVESQANFWLFLSFVQFQHRLLYFDWSLLRM